VDLQQKGLHEIVVTGFLPGVDANSFRVSRGVGSVTLLEFTYSVVTEEPQKVDDDTVKTAEEKLRAQIKQVDRYVQELDIRISQAQEEKAWLLEYAEKINSAGLGHGHTVVSRNLDLEGAQNFMKFYAGNLHRLEEELAKFAAQREDLQKQRNSLVNSQNPSKSQDRKDNRQFSISLVASDITQVTLQLSYVISGASWVSRYDVRVDSAIDDCVLTYFGVITNSSGEDWKDVLIALSTAAPSLGGEPPKLYPLHLEFEDVSVRAAQAPTSARGFARRTSIAAEMDQEARETARREREKEKEKKPQVNVMTSKVQNQGTSATYHIDRKSTIASDNKPHKVTIAKTSVDAVMEYVVVPAKSENAYLKAKATNTTAYQLLEGDMNVFMDGLFVTTSKLQRTNPGEEFQLYLGIDSGVRVEVKPTARQEEPPGLFKTKMTKTMKYNTVIRNNKKNPITVLIYDQLPFASDKSIRVTVKEPADNSEYTISEESIMKRSITLNPTKERGLKLTYVIEYPSEKQVFFVPQAAGNVKY